MSTSSHVNVRLPSIGQSVRKLPGNHKGVLLTEVDIKGSEKKMDLRITEGSKEKTHSISSNLLSKEKVGQDLVKIWTSLGDNARRELLKKKLDTTELYTNPQQTLQDLMKNFSL